MTEHGFIMVAELAYFTLAVPDTERGALFYGGLFGWRFDEAPAGHARDDQGVPLGLWQPVPGL